MVILHIKYLSHLVKYWFKALYTLYSFFESNLSLQTTVPYDLSNNDTLSLNLKTVMIKLNYSHVVSVPREMI